jgi:hypothetical protein
VVAGPPYVGMPGDEKEPVSDGVNETVGDLEAAALRSYVVPNFRPVRTLPAANSDVPSATRLLLGAEAGASAPLHLRSKLAH